MKESEFAKLSIKEAFRKLDSNLGGLSSNEATTRLNRLGFNEITEKKENSALKFAGKFVGPVPLLLWLVAVISYYLQRYADVFVIVGLLVFNAIVSFLEELRADNAVSLLEKRLPVQARVLRSGKWLVVPSRELVSGDVIRIRIGDVVPADCKVMEGQFLQVDESTLTGESMPVEKKKGSSCFAASAIRKGEATCLVTATGSQSFFGKTAKLVEEAKPKSRMQRVILGIVDYLMVCDVLMLVVIISFGVLVFHYQLVSLLPLALILFIASVPVALQATFTVAMALGTQRLAQKSVLVRKLTAIEDTSGMEVLCMDKTGTLTENNLAVREVWPAGKGIKDAAVLEAAVLASREEDNDPIDNAVLAFAKENKVSVKKAFSFTPFDPYTKLTRAVLKESGGNSVLVKGAVPSVVRLCRLEKKQLRLLNNSAEQLSGKGYRTIAVASSKRGGKFNLLGLIAFYDPPRKDARVLVQELRGLGVWVKMLTGDNLAVARQVASQVGLDGDIEDASELELGSGKANYSQIANASGFANIYPEDKLGLVKALQEGNRQVGMTGDGVNDAPALRQAQVGIAVANATDVAKSAASFVLTSSKLEAIIEAIKESRRIFQRMQTYALTKVAKAIQLILSIGVVFVASGGQMITTPLLLILLFFTNDFANLSISTDNANFSQEPESWQVGRIFAAAGAVGLMLVVQALTVFYFSMSVLGLSLAGTQTVVFLLFNISDKFTIINFREKGWFWNSIPSKQLLFTSGASVVVGIAMAHYGVLMASVGGNAIALAVGASIIFLFINDLVKRAAFSKLGIGFGKPRV